MDIPEKKITAIIDSVVHEPYAPSKEELWVQKIFERLMIENHLFHKNDADILLYQKMYHHAPDSASSLTKIRYWRTGRHIPKDRQTCLLLMEALELSDEEKSYFLRAVYNRNETLYESSDCTDQCYLSKMNIMHTIEEEFLMRISPYELLELNINRNKISVFLRHLFFYDCLHFTCLNHAKTKFSSHITSASFDSQFKRINLLLGEIPRNTILRHLFVYCAPFISLSRINELLEELGFYPLKEGHYTPAKERIDDYLIQMLKLYEEECKENNPAECLEWLHQSFAYADCLFHEMHLENYRIFLINTMKGIT